jgi:hypothetical protein
MNAFRALQSLARAGFLVKGVLYMVIGVLAIQVALRAGGRFTGTQGALTAVLGQPFGSTLLLVAAIGLFGYGAWRILQGLFDPDRLGHTWLAVLTRVTLVARGVVHGALGLQALSMYRGLGAASRTTERRIAAEAFQWPFGDWAVVLAGLGLIGYSVLQISAAISGRLERNLDVQELRREAGEWAVGISRFGVAARAVVFALLGWTIVAAGWSRNPSDVGNTAASLRTLAEQPGALGRWLLGVTAAGFVAYGFYEMIHARYLHIRRIH